MENTDDTNMDWAVKNGDLDQIKKFGRKEQIPGQ